MAIKEYSTFAKVPGLKPHHQMVLCHIQDTHWGQRCYLSTEMQLAYSTGPADWAACRCVYMW